MYANYELKYFEIATLNYFASRLLFSLLKRKIKPNVHFKGCNLCIAKIIY